MPRHPTFRRLGIRPLIRSNALEPLEDRLLLAADYGDAPLPYPTTGLTAAYHNDSGPMLGTHRDVEEDGQPDPLALGDDIAGENDDEDGVLLPPVLYVNSRTAIEVIASEAAQLNAWIDFSDDGSWAGAGDQIFFDFPLQAGTNTLFFDVPASASITPQTFARFRISSDGQLPYDGQANDGEVEDYAVELAFAPVEISGWVFDNRTGNGVDDPVRGIRSVGSVDTIGFAYNVDVEGDFAYVAGFTQLSILDVADPSAPVTVGSFEGSVRDVQVVGNLAYLARGSNGLEILDVGDPAAPRAVGSFETYGSAVAVDVVGDVAYIADFLNGVMIVDVSDPTAPAGLGYRHMVREALDVQAVGDQVYVAGHQAGLKILDVSDPTAPVVTSTFPTPHSAESVQVVGHLAYVTDSNQGLQIIDVSDPASPAAVGSLQEPSNTVAVHVVDGLAYVADLNNGLYVINVNDPAEPVVVARFETADRPGDVQVIGDLAYVADGEKGLQILDVSDPAIRIGHCDTSDIPTSMHVVDELAYIGEFRGLEIVDFSDPTAPRIAGGFVTTAKVNDVQMVEGALGKLAYLALGADGLQILDVNDPTAVTAMSSFQTLGSAQKVQVVNDLVYIVDGIGIQIADIWNPGLAHAVGEFRTLGTAFDAHVVGNLAYIADGPQGLQVVDVSNPAAPVWVGNLQTTSHALAVQVVGSYAYVLETHRGLTVVDVSNPAAPVAVGSIATPGWPQVLHVAKNLAYVTNAQGGLLVVDVSDPTAPVAVSSIHTDGALWDVRVLYDLVYYVTQSDGSFQIANIRGSRWEGVSIELYLDGGDGRFGSDGAGTDAGSGVNGDDDQLIANTTTESGSGAYTFENVPEGTYFVRQISPSGSLQTTTPAFYTITTQSAVDVREQNFGDAFFGSIHGFKFEDFDSDGIYTPGMDQPLAGAEFTVSGTDGQGNVVNETTTTDADGRFDFGQLLPSVAGVGPGTGYTVTETLPASHVATTPITFSGDLYSRQALVPESGYAMLPPGDPRQEIPVRSLIFGSHVKMAVDTFTSEAWGFTVDFSRPIDPSVLNLYDVESGTWGPADVTLVGDTTGPVTGSLFVDGKQLKFIATGGLLPADDYTVVLRSAADAFRDDRGGLLDGDDDGAAGGDFTTTFTLSAPESVVVSLPDFARGPSQPVDVPGSQAGLPVTLEDSRTAGGGITSLQLTVCYDPALLDVTAAVAGPDAPLGTVVVGDTATPGRIIVSLTSPTALPAGAVHFATLTATVPGGAELGAAQVVDICDLIINDNPSVAAIADDALQVAAYFGDATGNGTYSGLDARYVARIAAGLDGGLEAYPQIDPVIVAGVTGSGTLGDLDAQQIALKTVGLSSDTIPPMPQRMRLAELAVQNRLASETTKQGGLAPPPVYTQPTGTLNPTELGILAAARLNMSSVMRQEVGYNLRHDRSITGAVVKYLPVGMRLLGNHDSSLDDASDLTALLEAPPLSPMMVDSLFATQPTFAERTWGPIACS